MNRQDYRNTRPLRSHCTNPQVCMCEAVFHSKKIIVSSSQDDNLPVPVPPYKYRYHGTSLVTKYRHPTQSESNEDPSQVTSLPVVILLSHARDSRCKVVADQPKRVPEDCSSMTVNVALVNLCSRRSRPVFNDANVSKEHSAQEYGCGAR